MRALGHVAQWLLAGVSLSRMRLGRFYYASPTTCSDGARQKVTLLRETIASEGRHTEVMELDGAALLGEPA